MNVSIKNRYDFVHELRSASDLGSRLLHSEPVTQDLADLIEESFTAGALAERLPWNTANLEVEVRPVWQASPVVEQIELQLVHANGGEPAEKFIRSFKAGRWVRSAQQTAVKLREEGTLADGAVPHRVLIALERDQVMPVRLPAMDLPQVEDQSLEDFGVREFGAGQLVPDRPVLVNERLVEDCVQRCIEAGATETGGAVLGKVIRLAEPLPGTETRIVTILSATVQDPRHAGAPLTFTFSPEGLAEAARIGDLRGLGETVQTVFHTHGWGTSCGNCNQNTNCPIAECHPSLQDYVLLDSLLSSKATLLPIAGRKLGESGNRPVLQIFAWRGGEMRPIRYQQYRD